MIISKVQTPPMPPPCNDYGNYPMFGNLCYGPLTCQSSLWTYNVSPQLIKKNSNFSAELGLEPGSSDPETITLPMSYQADDEVLSFAWIQITNISIYVLVKNAMLSDLNDAYL